MIINRYFGPSLLGAEFVGAEMSSKHVRWMDGDGQTDRQTRGRTCGWMDGWVVGGWQG